MLGRTLGSYRIVSQIGEGGMGIVYLAEHNLIGRQAAMKVLRPEMAVRRDALGRFFNEAKAATLIRHPGIVEIYDFGYHEDIAYIVMELLRGESLRERLAKVGKFDATTTMLVGQQMAAALDAAHQASIIHRDIKPENVFLVADPVNPGAFRVKMLDFGIAKLSRDPQDSLMTLAGAFVGSARYAAPEQCKSAALVDARSDIYSLGCVLYEMACGEPPFRGDLTMLIGAHLNEIPPSPRTYAPEIPLALEHTILRTLEKAAHDRPQSMAELARALDVHASEQATVLTPHRPLHRATLPAPTLDPTPPPSHAEGPRSHEIAAAPSRSRRLRIAIAGGVVCGGLAAAAILVFGGRAPSDDAPATAPQVSKPNELAASPPNPSSPAVAPAPATVDTPYRDGSAGPTERPPVSDTRASGGSAATSIGSATAGSIPPPKPDGSPQKPNEPHRGTKPDGRTRAGSGDRQKGVIINDLYGD